MCLLFIFELQTALWGVAVACRKGKFSQATGGPAGAFLLAGCLGSLCRGILFIDALQPYLDRDENEEEVLPPAEVDQRQDDGDEEDHLCGDAPPKVIVDGGFGQVFFYQAMPVAGVCPHR
jgi:hypothetical protein